MNTFFTSDTHFMHKNIIHLGAGRPFDSIEDHDQAIIERWNATVSSGDTVYHLGDAAMGVKDKSLALFSQLNGRVLFVPGNHDNIFSQLTKSRQERFASLYKATFDEILPEVSEVEIEGQRFAISHFPYKEDWERFDDHDRFAAVRPSEELGLPLIHGHTH